MRSCSLPSVRKRIFEDDISPSVRRRVPEMLWESGITLTKFSHQVHERACGTLGSNQSGSSCKNAHLWRYTQYTSRQLAGVVPRSIDVMEFAKARAAELATLTALIKQQSGAKRVFQTLPHHMRRRAMSHNIKRMPVKLRIAAARVCRRVSHQSSSHKHRLIGD